MEQCGGTRAGCVAAAVALLLTGAPTAAQEPAAAEAPIDCAGLVAERKEATEELHAIRDEIGDIAMGRKPRKRQRLSGGAAARDVAQAAAGVLLPFPFGVLVGAGAAATREKKQAPQPPGPDVPALIERERLIEKRLTEIAAADASCPLPETGCRCTRKHKAEATFIGRTESTVP